MARSSSNLDNIESSQIDFSVLVLALEQSKLAAKSTGDVTKKEIKIKRKIRNLFAFIFISL
jgi:hypothetical protein